MENGQRLSGFNPRQAHVGFVVDKLALGQVFLRVLRLSSVSYHTTNTTFLYGSTVPSVSGPPPY
jgi:hypothetical protein